MSGVTAMGSAAGHRRKYADFARIADFFVVLDMLLVDGDADDVGVLKRRLVFLAKGLQVAEQIAHRLHIVGKLDLFFRLADPFAHPGEIEDRKSTRLNSSH